MNAPTVDLSGLADAIWKSLLDHLGDLGTAIWDDLTHWLYLLLRNFLLGVWHATLLPIPHQTTDQFAAVLSMTPDWRVVGGAGITMALGLMGLRTILRATPFDHTAAVDYLTGRFIGWTFVLVTLPWLIGHAIDIEQALALQVARADLDAALPVDATPNPVAFLLFVIFGIRLGLKLASNVVHVAVAVVWSPVAAVLGLIPNTSHIASLWAHEFFGRLAGAVLATVAAGIGLALVLGGTGGSIFSAVGAAGAMIAAADMVDWLAKTPGTSIGGVAGQMIRFASMLPGPALPAAGAAPAAGAIGGSSSTALAVPAAAGGITRYSFD